MEERTLSKYDAINQGILNNDIRALREALGNICYADAGFKTNDFADALAEIKEHNIAIKDPSLYCHQRSVIGG